MSLTIHTTKPSPSRSHSHAAARKRPTPADARANLELGDLALLTAPGGTSTFLRADKTWVVPPSGGGGSTTLLGLTDVPDTYTGQATKVLAVRADETGTEFVTPAAAGALPRTPSLLRARPCLPQRRTGAHRYRNDYLGPSHRRTDQSQCDRYELHGRAGAGCHRRDAGGYRDD